MAGTDRLSNGQDAPRWTSHNSRRSTNDAVDGAVSDADLVSRARAGDMRAFRMIVSRYEATIAAVVISMLGPGGEADDVGQETFVRLFRSLDQFRGDAALSTYLTRIAMNLSLNELKRRKRRSRRFLRIDESAGVEIRDPGAGAPAAGAVA